MKTVQDNKVMDVDEDLEANECDRCIHMFPLCMIEGEQLLSCKRINEIMQNVFRD